MKILRTRARFGGGSCRQGGFTLIELSVATLVALFLLGGVFAMEQSTRKTFGNQNLLAQLQDNQRLAMTLINDIAQSAGYFPDPTSHTSANALPALGAFATGQAIWGTHSAAVPNDTLYVRYMTAPGDSILLCNGTVNPAASATTHSYVNEFSVVNGYLVCTLGTDAIGATPVPLVGAAVGASSNLQVTNLQVWYGIKRNFAVSDNNVDTYARADQMATADWANITSIKVILTFANPLSGQPGQPATIDFMRVIDVMNRSGIST